MENIKSMTFSSLRDAPRCDTTTNLVDWWLIRTAPTILISLFGTNAGAAQFVQTFDTAFSPTVAVSDSVSATDVLITAAQDISTGQRVRVDSGITGIANGTISYALRVSATAILLYDTLAHAQAGGATGRRDVTADGVTGVLSLVPQQTFAVASADNFSSIVPMTGMGFSKGIVVGVSTTRGTYTNGTKDLAILATLQA